MFSTLRLHVSNPVIKTNDIHTFAGNLHSRRRVSGTVRPARPFTCLSLKSNNAAPPELQSFVSTQFTSSVGLSPSSLQLSQWNLTHRNINVLNVIALVTAISATWLFCSAIPTLLAFKKAAESFEKLLDVTREELPGTMAAVRLSGMEISDLTMELSDLGQEITQGVRNSTRAVRMAEERLRGLTNMTPPAMVQGLANQKIGAAEPLLARSARGLREGIVKGRSLLQLFFTLTRFSKMALNYFATRAKS